MAERLDAVDLIVLDPPRAGLDSKALNAICGIKCRDIIYVSCNPATQARDVKYLTANGYVLQSLQPLDMFSQTEHVETVGLLRRK
jgi:23S rRNA (uracil1939-C5)-methyltransferase